MDEAIKALGFKKTTAVNIINRFKRLENSPSENSKSLSRIQGKREFSSKKRMESINIKRKEMRLRLRRTGSTISGSQVYKRRMSPKRNLTHPRLNIASIDLHD